MYMKKHIHVEMKPKQNETGNNNETKHRMKRGSLVSDIPFLSDTHAMRQLACTCVQPTLLAHLHAQIVIRTHITETK